MNKDILVKIGEDLKFINADVTRAGNILSIQLGDLEYAQTTGIDMRYFLESEFAIQNESFKAYCVQRLMESQVNIVNAYSEIDTLFEKMTFVIGENNLGAELIS